MNSTEKKIRHFGPKLHSATFQSLTDSASTADDDETALMQRKICSFFQVEEK